MGSSRRFAPRLGRGRARGSTGSLKRSPGWSFYKTLGLSDTIPSGKHTNSYGKSPCFMGSTINICKRQFSIAVVVCQRVTKWNNIKHREQGTVVYWIDQFPHQQDGPRLFPIIVPVMLAHQSVPRSSPLHYSFEQLLCSRCKAKPGDQVTRLEATIIFLAKNGAFPLPLFCRKIE